MLRHVGGPQMPTLPGSVQGSSSMGMAVLVPAPASPPTHPQFPNIHNLETARQSTETKRRKPLIPWSILDMFLGH